MAATIVLGPIRLTLILDGMMRIEGDELFHPASREEWAVGLEPDERGTLPVVINGVLISAGNEHTLVDTGLGEEEGGKARPQNLAQEPGGRWSAGQTD